MGGIFQFFDFNQASTSRKLVAHKRHNDGLEAPRNSLEFSLEASQNYHVIQEDIPYSCQVKHQPSKMNIYPNGTPVKNLIDEEMSNRTNTTKSAPSVVARLMGMDPFPSDVISMITRKEIKDTSVIRRTSHSSPSASKKITQEIFPHTKISKSKKAQPREHPQEELLQKFKKDFEAWQTSKVQAHSRSLELGKNDLQRDRENRILAQENLNRERLARYMNAKAYENPRERMLYTLAPKLKVNTRQGGDLWDEEYSSKEFYSNSKDDMKLNIRETTKSFEHVAIDKFYDKGNIPSSPTRIVVLKPSSEEFEELRSGSSEIQDREGSMRDFLEEVKERLRAEIHGKARDNGITRVLTAETTDTSFCNNSTDPRQIARNIAKQIRESVTRDLGTMLMRSESTRSYKSELQFNGSDTPEFIHRDTRRQLSERLKNVLKNDTNVDVPSNNNGRSRTDNMIKERVRLKPILDLPKMQKKITYWEERRIMTESKARCFRHGPKENGTTVDSGAVSPRNLVRSFSAPVSGTAFGKLLLEDQHVPTGAHIRRKHEVTGYNSPEIRTSRKDAFNLKGKVSNLRHNFNLKGKLFGKKNLSMDKSASNGFDPMKPLTTAPSVVMNLGIAQENSTEVPPSPASVSSSSNDELCRPGLPSPVSPLEVPFADDHQSTQDSGELSSGVSAEVRNVSGQAENFVSEEQATKAVPVKVTPCEYETAEIESNIQAYVRDILVTAGLYGGEAFDQAFPMWDALTKPISKWVFDEVEEACSIDRMVEDNDAEILLKYNDRNGWRKLLFDLINEALPRVIRTPMISSTFKKWVLGPNTLPYGKKMLDDLWHQIKIHANPLVDETHSLDSMVAWDLRMTSWSNISYEDIDFMGIDMEVVILDDLIDEFVCDVCS